MPIRVYTHIMTSVGLEEKPVVGEDLEEEKEKCLKRYREIISRLPKEEGWSSSEIVYQYEGFWMQFKAALEGIMWMQQHYKPRHDDILLVSLPKSGTTWFKPLMFCIVNRTRYDSATSRHPLFTTSPHELVPSLEIYLHLNISFPDYGNDQKLFHTHLPFTSFSQSMIDSGCRIIYVCRNPKDVFVSLFYFMQKMGDKKQPPVPLEKAFEQFCNGVCVYGPYWNHVLGFWKASLQWPERVMFMRYEDMKKDPRFHLKRLAEFAGCPFSEEEERRGVMDEILESCSFQKMSNLEVNKTGVVTAGEIIVEKNTFLRKGEVGDWKRHLTAEMADRIDEIFEGKLAGSGLTF